MVPCVQSMHKVCRGASMSLNLTRTLLGLQRPSVRSANALIELAVVHHDCLVTVPAHGTLLITAC